MSAPSIKGGGVASYPRLRKVKRDDRITGFLMVSPAVVFTLAMIIFPIGYAVFLSVTKWAPGSSAIHFVGLNNFGRMLSDHVFWSSFRVTMILFVACLLIETIIGIYLGIFLSKDIPGQKVLQAVILIPSIIASVAIGMMWIQILDPTLGFANYLLSVVGLKPLAWLANPDTVLQSLIIIDVWQWSPFMALIITGGMRTLPSEPFEAAVIDGASKWQIFRFVTLPLLRPVVMVAVLLRSVDLVRFFDTVYIMTQGGPNNASMTLNVYSYLQGFNYMDMSYGSAIMLFLLLLVMLISLVITKLRGRTS
ncbi:trehalose transport system permease protein SugA [Peptococcaceae bacterium CEB3]|nr:trehalose transport system permease protein SugA [Peptococcaceae bacterium CEB3]